MSYVIVFVGGVVVGVIVGISVIALLSMASPDRDEYEAGKLNDREFNSKDMNEQVIGKAEMGKGK